MSKFTKGPWVLDQTPDHESMHIKKDGRPLAIIICVDEETRANGYLIQRAPDMYTMLSITRDILININRTQKSDSLSDLIYEANKILKKARGES